MVESAKPPALEELLERIVRLENTTANLQATLDDLGGAFEKDLEEKSDHFNYIYQLFADYLWPMVHKVFPGYVAAIQQGEAILNRGSSNEGKERR